uniref:Uncharacterized protein n=1 Tax=Lepeophtheirus salmonis TaxID=72036 RepID=A0A0K2V6Q7_LEPSM
MTILLDFHHKS